jgi:hypothetical protein
MSSPIDNDYAAIAESITNSYYTKDQLKSPEQRRADREDIYKLRSAQLFLYYVIACGSGMLWESYKFVMKFEPKPWMTARSVRIMMGESQAVPFKTWSKAAAGLFLSDFLVQCICNRKDQDLLEYPFDRGLFTGVVAGAAANSFKFARKTVWTTALGAAVGCGIPWLYNSDPLYSYFIKDRTWCYLPVAFSPPVKKPVKEL